MSIGSRIRELRERAGVQSQTLAASLRIDPSAMSNIERGKRAVKSSEVAAIASILGVSPLAILSGDSLLSAMPVAARATNVETSSDLVVRTLTELAELHELLSGSGLRSSPSLEAVPHVDLDAWRQSAEDVARWARENVLPPTDGGALDRFAELAEAIERNLSVDVMVEDCPRGGILGASITDRRFPLILVSRSQLTSRALFTLAHELGHIFLGDGDEAIRLDVSLTLHTKPEMFANAFAASLLMPQSTVQEEIDMYGVTSKALARLVARFGVSFESLVYRLHNLGHISAATRDRLQSRGLPAVLANLGEEDRRRALARQGASPERRPPGLLTLRTLRGYQVGVVSVRPLAGLLGQDPDELLERYVRERDSVEAWGLGRREDPQASFGTSDEDRYSGVPA